MEAMGANFSMFDMTRSGCERSTCYRPPSSRHSNVTNRKLNMIYISIVRQNIYNYER